MYKLSFNFSQNNVLRLVVNDSRPSNNIVGKVGGK